MSFNNITKSAEWKASPGPFKITALNTLAILHNHQAENPYNVEVMGILDSIRKEELNARASALDAKDLKHDKQRLIKGKGSMTVDKQRRITDFYKKILKCLPLSMKGQKADSDIDVTTFFSVGKKSGCNGRANQLLKLATSPDRFYKILQRFSK
jgi:hypothetical protein